MTARPDLRRLLDQVAQRAHRIDVVVDPRLEQSIVASVYTDVHGDAAATFTRYAPDSAAEALEAALRDAARWSNAQPAHRRPIALDTVEPILKLVEVVKRLAPHAVAADQALVDYAMVLCEAVCS